MKADHCGTMEIRSGKSETALLPAPFWCTNAWNRPTSTGAGGSDPLWLCWRGKPSSDPLTRLLRIQAESNRNGDQFFWANADQCVRDRVLIDSPFRAVRSSLQPRDQVISLSLSSVGQAEAGGEGVSQSPLKDKHFRPFVDQNPPFELRRNTGFRFRPKVNSKCT